MAYQSQDDFFQRPRVEARVRTASFATLLAWRAVGMLERVFAFFDWN
jgi:hypothetical protein